MKLNFDAFGDCVEKIAARGRITSGEASQILQEVANRAEQMRRTGQPDPFVTAAKELGASIKETARKNRLDAVRNATIRSRVLNDVEKNGGIATAHTGAVQSRLAFAAAVTALPAFALARPSLDQQVRDFSRHLLSNTGGLTVGEVLERKRIAKVLQALIGDEVEPWTPWELEDWRDMQRRWKPEIWGVRS